MKRSSLPITEDIDFHYLLSLMPPLSGDPNFAWLPELFSIIDSEALLLLCKYCGGETIKIPTLDQMQSSIDALQWFYDIDIKHCRDEISMPANLKPLLAQIRRIYNAPDNKESDKQVT